LNSVRCEGKNEKIPSQICHVVLAMAACYIAF
jgi:hypothetical protein